MVVLVLALVLVAQRRVFADQAFVGLSGNKTNLVVQPPAGGQVVVDGVVIRSLVEQVKTLTQQLEAQAQQMEAQAQQMEALKAQLTDVGAAAPVLQVSGAGVAVVNGQYIHYGINEGRPVYIKVQANSDLFVTGDGAYVWIAFGATYSLTTTTGTNAITGICGSAVGTCGPGTGSPCGCTACAAGGCPAGTGCPGTCYCTCSSSPVCGCAQSAFVKTAALSTAAKWQLGDTSGKSYFTSTSFSTGGLPPTTFSQWSLGADGAGQLPSLSFI